MQIRPIPGPIPLIVGMQDSPPVLPSEEKSPRAGIPAAPAAKTPLEGAKEARLDDAELGKLTVNQRHFSVETPFGVIDFVRAGKKGGRVILLIPGTPGQCFDFHRLVPLLVEKGFDVLVVSPPGKGHSTASERFSFAKGLDAYGDFWSWLLKAFALEEVTAVGFSVGFGEITHAMLRSEEAHNRVSGLVSVGGWAPLFNPQKFHEGADKAFTQPWVGQGLYAGARTTGIFRAGVRDSLVRLREKPEVEVLLDEYMKGIPAIAPPEEKDPKVLAETNQRIGWYCKTTKVQYDVNDQVQGYFDQQAEGRMRFSAKPLLAIVGDQDQIMRLAEEANGVGYARGFFEHYQQNSAKPDQNQCKIYAGDGHMIPYENPETLAQDIAAFVNGDR